MQSQNAIMQFLPLAAIMLIFYFLLIRPQQKQMKERKAMLDSVKAGDKVLTTGGIAGTVTAANGDDLELEIAKGVKVSLVRSAVASIIKS